MASRSPEDIELFFKSRIGIGHVPPPSTEEEMDEYDEDAITDEEKAWRTERVKELLAEAEQVWVMGAQEELAGIAEKIADGARDASWRLPLGDSGLLAFFLTVIPDEGLTHSLKLQTLRVIGNAAADCDENRARVVQSGQLRNTIINFLDDDSLLPFVIPVIFNICVDYEPAQLHVCEVGLSKKLVNILTSSKLSTNQPAFNIAVRILELLVSQDAEPKFANPSTPALLLNLATSTTSHPTLGDFTQLCTVALAYLTYEQFQTTLLESNDFPVLQQAFYDSYTRFPTTTATCTTTPDPAVADQLKQVWNAFVTIFADISAHPSFVTIHPLDSPVVARLISWLSTPSSFSHLQTAACLSLGNLSRSETSSTALAKLVAPQLSTILSHATAIPPSPSQTTTTAPPAQLLHAALSFLKNLAIPQINKPLLGSNLFPSTLPTLWTTTATQPQVQFAAISLARQLLLNSPTNVSLICAPFPSFPSSPSPSASPSGVISNLHTLLTLSAKIDDEPSKTEIARAVCAVCRTLHSPSPSDTSILPDDADWRTKPHDKNTTTSTPRARFYAAHPSIAPTLASLLVQNRFAPLRSEALFVLALMSRSPDGARVALQALQPVEACRALVKIVTGEDGVLLEEEGEGEEKTKGDDEQVPLEGGSPATGTMMPVPHTETGLAAGLGLEPQQVDAKQPASMARMDRENGLVLTAELLREFSDVLPPRRRRVMEDMLAKGGEIVLEERKEGKTAEGQ
ncbi:hypothetical protein B0T19DRAFT_415253 [Cercophora scortea]|uniref:Uncharacterized protein n=1 Tax=Cercophora scortea TaxID=314031 RepID=A0AAE0MHW3_9PEZI|nr:hypothetical protein B0T19DRAFT_415253 [Cercophora scortea]